MEPMRALYFEKTGEPEAVLQCGTRAKPLPGPGEVRIRILAAPVNPADFYFIRGRYRIAPQLPEIAGLEAAGLIDALGEHVELPVGALVSVLSIRAWAEYVVVPARDVFILPAGFPLEKAAQFTLNPITAWGLLEYANLTAGDWLLMNPGNSAIASLVVQMAHRLGIRTILVVRSSGQEAALKALGATEVVIFDEGSMVSTIQALTGGKGVAAALDAIGGITGSRFIQCLAPNGRLIAYGVVSPEPASYYNTDLVYRNISLRGFGVRGYIAGKTPAQLREVKTALASLLADPGFRLDVRAVFAPEQFRNAIRVSNEPGKNGKVLLSFQ